MHSAIATTHAALSVIEEYLRETVAELRTKSPFPASDIAAIDHVIDEVRQTQAACLAPEEVA